jgi:predicted site-specific integrase-resolvase
VDLNSPSYDNTRLWAVFNTFYYGNSENKNNLERQRERVLNYCAAKGYQVESVVCEIGSGLNDERRKLEKILMDESI